MYYLNGKNVWQYKHAIAIYFANFLYFVSINFRESVIKLVGIRKAFANCKKNFENWTGGKHSQRMWKFTNFTKGFAPQKFILLRYAPFSLALVE